MYVLFNFPINFRHEALSSRKSLANTWEYDHVDNACELTFVFFGQFLFALAINRTHQSLEVLV